MTGQFQQSSTIVALCYKTPPQINFATMAVALGRSLARASGVEHTIRSLFDDLAIYDLHSVRVGIALCDLTPSAENPAQYRKSLIISVGSIPNTVSGGKLFDRRVAICEGLARKLAKPHPADCQMKLDINDSLTEELFDTIQGRLWPEEIEQSDLIAQDQLLGQLALSVAVESCSGHAPPEALVAELDRKFSLHLNDKLQRDQHEAEAEVLPDIIPAEPLSTPKRLAIYALNSAVMLISLPIGSAIMTYAILGRENLRTPALAMGLSGALAGISSSAAAQQILTGLG
jgi:hypothetical protein